MIDERIEELKRQIAHLEEHARLAEEMKATGKAFEAEPTPEKYAAHIAAEVAFAEHRASVRGPLHIIADKVEEV